MTIHGSNRPQKISIKTIALRLVYEVSVYDAYHEDGEESLEEEKEKFNVTYRVSNKDADLVLALGRMSRSGVQMGLGEHVASLMSPSFQLSNDKKVCLILRFKALDWLTIMLGYVNSSGRYEERLLHRNLYPLSSVDFFTLRRDVGGLTVEGQQFVLVFESKSQQVNKDLIIINDIQLQENQCNYTAAWDGFCDFSSTDGSSCPMADQSEFGNSWSPALLISSNNESTTGLRSEFYGRNRGEVSRLLTAPYTATVEAPCLLLSAKVNPTDIRVDFSLWHADNTSLLPTPKIDQTTSPNDSKLQLYYIHLPVGVPVMLEIKASSIYFVWIEYSAVFLLRIKSNSCNIIEPEIPSAEPFNCTNTLSLCGYRLGADWSDSPSSSDNRHACADDNLCLSRVVSSSPQFAWKYSAGKFTRIEGDDVLFVVYDLYGTLNLTEVDKFTTIYLNVAGSFIATLQTSFLTNKRGCTNYAKFNANISIKANGQVEEKWTNLSTTTNWSSIDMLQIYIKPSVARCVKLIKYFVNGNNTTQGYSLQLVRNSDSYFKESDDLTAQWTSDVIPVGLADTVVCLAVDLVLPSIVQAKLLQELQNGTVLNGFVFTSGSVTNDRIRGEFQLLLDRKVSRIQVAVFFNENATINNISLEFGPCLQNASEPNINLSCNFTNFNTCGYHDASEKESRWVATAVQAKRTGVEWRRECVSDADGGNYTGRQNVTFSGKPCLPWNSQKYAHHPFDDISYFADSFADSDDNGTAVVLDDVSNYCRNPSFDGTYEIWPWCLVKDDLEISAIFRKEYCSIPFCQEYFLKVVFGKMLDSAELLAPPIRFKGAACLQFQYRLSHPKIILRIQKTVHVFNSSSIQKLMELNYAIQVNVSNWSTANITLNSPDDQIHHVAFVAEKIGFTVDPEYAALRDIVMTYSPCPQPDENKEQQEVREPYTGNRQPIDSFRDLVLNDNAQYNMGDLLNMTGHLQERLIYKCTWNNAECSETDIRSELTDLGLCYTFNGDESRTLSSNNTGVEFGLRLILNVEQYENVPIYNNTGIKIHLRNYDDVPQVKDSGFTVSPGYQTLAPIDHLTVENLEPPWGKCSKMAYDYFNSTERYTAAKCQLKFKTESLVKACGCKDFYMPGPAEICSLMSNRSCAESSKDEGQCSCPVECQIFSYATALSFSQLSGVSFADILRNSDTIRNDYWKSLEIAHRVDDTKIMQTISTLESVIVSHRQLKTLIYENILSPVTSQTNVVLKALRVLLMDIVLEDVVLSKRFLENFHDCYKGNFEFLVNYISDQLSTASQKLRKLQNSANGDTTAKDEGLLEHINTMIKSANDFLSEAANENKTFCPDNFFAKACFSFRHMNVTTGDLSNAQLNISQVLSCISQYAEFLKAFMTFLDTVDRIVPKVDMAVATRTMNKLSADARWLEGLLAAYRNGSLTKRRLSDEFLQRWSNNLLLGVDSASSVVEFSVLSEVRSIINTIETRTISVYTQLINYLYKLQTFMPARDETVNSFARKQLIWRNPFPVLQDKPLPRYRLTSYVLEQAMGVETTLAAFANQSESFVTMLVFAYDTSLKQTLSTIQSQLQSAQQEVIKHVNAFSQLLIKFNDSTLIGDSFVRTNFLEVDIFYGELKNQTIRQKKGYDLIQFLGEFGGWFGLFLGGSILSIFEFLDLLIYNFIGKMSTKKPKKEPSSPVLISVLPTSEVQNSHSRSATEDIPLESIGIK